MENRKLMRKPERAILGILVLLIIFSLVAVSKLQQGQWMLFRAKEIRGSVVDAATTKPVEGAIVIGMWQLTHLLDEGFGGYAKVVMVRTGKDGKFLIPTWTTFKPWKFASSVDELAPKIIIYKPGYKVYWSHNKMRAGFPANISMSWEEKDKVRDKFSIDPAKLEKIYKDEEILRNYDEFSTQADFPSAYYEKKQSVTIFNAFDEDLSQLTNKNEFSTRRLIISNRELRKFWTGDNK